MRLDIKRSPFLALTALTFAFWVGGPASSQAAGGEIHAQCLQSMKLFTSRSSELQPVVQFFQEQSRLAKLVDGQILAEEEGAKGTHFGYLF